MTLVLLTVVPLLALPRPIDGKWAAKVNLPAGRRGGEARPVEMILDLKTDGERLTGSVFGGAGRRGRSIAIQEGKIDGDRISFQIVRRGRQGERKILWEGRVEGDELKLTRAAEGRRGRDITFKRM